MAPKATKKAAVKKPAFVEKKQSPKKVVPTTLKKVTTKKAAPKKTTPKAKKSASLEEGVDGVIEYESLGKIDDWDWTETAGVDSFVSDDAGGFLCLEEISDVEVEYEGDDVTGKVAKFKVKKDPFVF